MIRLRLFGTIDLRREDSRRARAIVLQPKRLALLAYLACDPESYHRRDTLLGLFWPELDTDRARGALSKALHYLRRSLGDEVLASRGDEELSVDRARLWCDVPAFDRALGAGNHDEALELYRGDLLRGFFLSGAPGFERWVEAERARLRRGAASAGWSLAGETEAAGDLPLAIHWARRAHELDADDEAGLRRVLSLLERAGDRAGAVRAYEDFARRLALEFELEPGEETQALIARIRGPRPRSDGVRAGDLADAGDRLAREPTRVGPSRSRQPVDLAARPLGRRRVYRAVATGAVAALAVLGLSYAFGARSLTSPLDPQRVLVAPFENRTGTDSLDPVGAMAADWIIQGLTAIGRVQVVPFAATLTSARRVAARARDTDSTEHVRALAREAGVGTVVTGSYYVQGDSIYLHARIIDARRGTVLEALEPVNAPVGLPLVAVDSLRQQVVAALAPHVDPRTRDVAQVASRTPSYEAYREYARGMDQLIASGDWRGALQRFALALEHDPDFAAPLVRSAVIYQATNNPAAADSVVRLLGPRRDQLAEFDREVVAAVDGWTRGDHMARYHATARAAQLAPNTMAHYDLAAVLVVLNRPREAVRVLETIDPERGELGGWFHYWIRLADAHHLLGNYRQELKVARRAGARGPEDGRALRLELRALIALGRVPEAMRRLDEHLATPADPQRWDLLRHTALELHAHGQTDAARRLFEMSRAYLVAQSSPQPRHLGEVYYRADRLDEAERVLLAAAGPGDDDVHVTGLLGAIAARRGDRETAERLSASLAALDQPHLLGHNTYWRVRIAALLGDRDQAVELLRAAYGEGRGAWIEIHVEPDLDSLRQHPPFLELTRPRRRGRSRRKPTVPPASASEPMPVDLPARPRYLHAWMFQQVGPAGRGSPPVRSVPRYRRVRWHRQA